MSIYVHSAHSSCLVRKTYFRWSLVMGKKTGSLHPDAETLHLTTAINIWVFKDTLKKPLYLSNLISNLTISCFSTWEGGRQNVKETKPIRIFL